MMACWAAVAQEQAGERAAGIVSLGREAAFDRQRGNWARTASHFAAVGMAYFTLNVGYSFALKHVPFVDVVIIALGFILRIFGGAVAIDVPLHQPHMPPGRAPYMSTPGAAMSTSSP